MNKRELTKYAEKFRCGDKEAFAVVYEQTKKGVYSYIYSYVLDRYAAEDLSHDTYIKAQLKIDSFSPGTNFLAWMLQIAKNTALNYLSKRKRETELDEEELKDIPDERGSDHDTPILDAAKKVLNEDELRILILHAISGYKHREIAEMTAKPLGTVTWTYKNAIAKVKIYLEKENGK